MESVSMLVILFVLVMSDYSSYSLNLPPTIDGRFPYWSPYYVYNRPFVHPSIEEIVERAKGESIKQLKHSLNPKRPEVLQVLDEWNTLNEANRTSNGTSRPIGSSYSRSWPLSKQRTATFGPLHSFPWRDKASIKQLDNLSRFVFIGSGNIGFSNNANYLFKTSYVFTSATATVCVLTSCIPADQFASGSSTVTCSRKRSAMEYYDDEAIESSQVERFVPTALSAMANSETFELETASPSLQNLEALLSPSFAISAAYENDRDSPSFSIRQKRFLFVLTTTITTYTFVTTTRTYTISLYSNGGGLFPTTGTYTFATTFRIGASLGGSLTCRPANIALC